MKIKETFKKNFLFCIFIVFSLVLMFFLNFFLENLFQTGLESMYIENVFAHANQKPTEIGLPMYLRIDKLGVDAIVEYAGLTADGALVSPKSQDDVAWFKFGHRPGEIGSAVISGHYGQKDRRGSVFDTLYMIRPGDEITIEDDKGVITTFVVREERRYSPKDDISSVFSAEDGRSHLNLITCEGEFDSISKTYSLRLVVFADRVF